MVTLVLPLYPNALSGMVRPQVLENEPAFNVFFRLDDPRQLLHCASVSTEWRQWADDERLWRRMCRTAFQLATRRVTPPLMQCKHVHNIHRQTTARLAPGSTRASPGAS